MCTTDFSVIWKTTLTELGKSPNCPHSQILPMTHWPSTHCHHPEMTLCSWHADLRPINIILRWRCAADTLTFDPSTSPWDDQNTQLLLHDLQPIHNFFNTTENFKLKEYCCVPLRYFTILQTAFISSAVAESSSWDQQCAGPQRSVIPKRPDPESPILKLRTEGVGSVCPSNPPEYKQDSMYKSTSTLSWVWCLPPYNHMNQKCASFT